MTNQSDNIEIDTSEIAPSQDYLKEKTVRFIFDCLENNEINNLPPKPLVRRVSEGKFVAIDGHNLIAVRAYFAQSIEVVVAESTEMIFPESSPSNIDRNNELAKKFESSLIESQKAKVNGINSFADLIAKYPNLFSDQ